MIAAPPLFLLHHTCFEHGWVQDCNDWNGECDCYMLPSCRGFSALTRSCDPGPLPSTRPEAPAPKPPKPLVGLDSKPPNLMNQGSLGQTSRPSDSLKNLGQQAPRMDLVLHNMIFLPRPDLFASGHQLATSCWARFGWTSCSSMQSCKKKAWALLFPQHDS
jgi:hypothetical protein